MSNQIQMRINRADKQHHPSSSIQLQPASHRTQHHSNRNPLAERPSGRDVHLLYLLVKNDVDLYYSQLQSNQMSGERKLEISFFEINLMWICSDACAALALHQRRACYYQLNRIYLNILLLLEEIERYWYCRVAHTGVHINKRRSMHGKFMCALLTRIDRARAHNGKLVLQFVIVVALVSCDWRRWNGWMSSTARTHTDQRKFKLNLLNKSQQVRNS